MTLHALQYPTRPALALLLTSLGFSTAVPAAAADGTAVPPGMVLVQGGSRMVLGEDKDVIEEHIVDDVQVAPNLAGEVPQQRVAVGDFYLMTTEVTNEQYVQFVEATGHKVPMTWGKDAIDEAQREFSDAQGLRIREAQEAGEPLPERESFDREKWWDANWSTAEYAVPRGEETFPVAYVDYSDIHAYCEWAGFRPMTEVEYQAAGRGSEEWSYPWGQEWNGDNAHTSQERNQGDPRAVGSFPDGATKDGVFDLVGNVWEWTSSPYVAYKGYEPWRVRVGTGRTARDVSAMAEWNADRRVVVGGSFQNTKLAARLTTRRPTDRDQRTNALGFRCAATPTPALDQAGYAAGRVPRELRPAEGFATEVALGFDRWHAADGRADVPNYGVVTGYDHVLWAPSAQVPANNSSRLLDRTLRTGPIALGLLSTSVPLLEPALEPGTYVVAWRGEGKPRGDDDEEEEPAAEGILRQETDEDGEPPAAQDAAPAYDIEQENLFFITEDGTVAAVLPLAKALDYTRPDRKEPNGKLEFEPFDGSEEQVAKLAEAGDVPKDTARITAPVKSETTKVFVLEIPLRFTRGTLDDSWRR